MKSVVEELLRRAAAHRQCCAAGQPILAEENIEDHVTVDPRVGGDEGEYVLSRSGGNSMIDAGIFAGGFVVVRPQDTASRR